MSDTNVPIQPNIEALLASAKKNKSAISDRTVDDLQKVKQAVSKQIVTRGENQVQEQEAGIIPAPAPSAQPAIKDSSRSSADEPKKRGRPRKDSSERATIRAVNRGSDGSRHVVGLRMSKDCEELFDDIASKYKLKRVDAFCVMLNLSSMIDGLGADILHLSDFYAGAMRVNETFDDSLREQIVSMLKRGIES